MSAIISKCGKYRYRLERSVGDSKKTCLFIMLNPSKANEVDNDPTIRRCIRFAQSFGCGRLLVGNLFAYRETKAAALKKCTQPDGVDNRKHLRKMCGEADIVIAAWGVHGKHLGQGERVLEQLRGWRVPVHFLALTKDGYPRHPLYLKTTVKPKRWKWS